MLVPLHSVFNGCMTHSADGATAHYLQ